VAAKVAAEPAALPERSVGNKAGSITARTCNPDYSVMTRPTPSAIETTPLNTAKADHRPPKLDIPTTPFVGRVTS
jgi:hypothetical protein